MLKAAHFDGQLEAEAEDDLDDLFETEKTRKVDKEGKKLRKVLNKREGGVYDSDEEDGLCHIFPNQIWKVMKRVMTKFKLRRSHRVIPKLTTIRIRHHVQGSKCQKYWGWFCGYQSSTIIFRNYAPR